MKENMKRIALCASLILAVTILTGATINLPPRKSGPIRVQSAGAVASTGTGTGTDGVIRYYSAADFVNLGSGLSAYLPDRVTGKPSAVASVAIDAKKPVASGTCLSFPEGTYLQSGVFDASEVGTGQGVTMVLKCTRKKASTGFVQYFCRLGQTASKYFLPKLRGNNFGTDGKTASGTFEALETGDTVVVDRVMIVALRISTVTGKFSVCIDGGAVGNYGPFANLKDSTFDLSQIWTTLGSHPEVAVGNQSGTEIYGMRVVNRPLTNAEMVEATSGTGAWSW